MQQSRYGRTGIIDEYLIYPFNGPIGYNYNYSGTYSNFSLVDKFYVNSLVKNTKRLISGGAEWSSGLTFSLSDIYYSFSGEILSYSASFPGLTLSNGDPSYPRIDSIVITEDNTIKVKKGVPSATPVKTPLNEDEILIQYAYIPASGTTIGTKVPVYLTNSQWQSSSYLTSGTYSGTFSFTSTSTPFDGGGDFCVDVTSDYRTGVKFTRPIGTLKLSDYGSLTFRVRFSEIVPGNRSLVAQIQGTSSQFTGTASSNVLNLMSYGVDREIINKWQHIVVPITKFGSVVSHAKTLSFRLIGGTPNSNHNWKLDNIYFQTGAPYDEYMGEPDPSSTGGTFSYNVAPSNEWLKSVFGRTNSVPTSPNAGDRYLIIPTATDIFTGMEDQVAEFDGLAATWSFTIPTNGTSVRVDDEDNSIYRYEGDYSSGIWVKELLDQVLHLDASTSNSGLSYSATSTPSFNYYGKQTLFLVSFGATNSLGTASLSINDIGYTLLKKIAATSGVVDLEADDLKVGGLYNVAYDGEYFQVNLGGGGSGGGTDITTNANTGILITPGSTSSAIDTVYNTALDSALSMPSTVGGIASGTTVADLYGMNLVQLFNDLLFPTVNPTYTIPTISISSTVTGTNEIGSTVNPAITLTGTENDADYFSQLVINKSVNGGANSALSTVSSTSSMTVAAVSNIASQFGYSDPNNPNYSYSIGYNDTGLVVPAPASGGSSTVVYSGVGNYEAGLAKKNNKGVTHSASAAVRSTSSPQASSTNFSSNSQTITGYYPYFYGKTSTQQTAADIVNIIQSGSGYTKVVNSGNGSLSMAFNATGEWPWFAVYSVYSTKTAWYENALNNGSIGGVTDLFASPTTLSVVSSDGYWTVTFKIYPANKVTTIGTATIS